MRNKLKLSLIMIIVITLFTGCEVDDEIQSLAADFIATAVTSSISEAGFEYRFDKIQKDCELDYSTNGIFLAKDKKTNLVGAVDINCREIVPQNYKDITQVNGKILFCFSSNRDENIAYDATGNILNIKFDKVYTSVNTDELYIVYNDALSKYRIIEESVVQEAGSLPVNIISLELIWGTPECNSILYDDHIHKKVGLFGDKILGKLNNSIRVLNDVNGRIVDIPEEQIVLASDGTVYTKYQEYLKILKNSIWRSFNLGKDNFNIKNAFSDYCIINRENTDYIVNKGETIKLDGTFYKDLGDKILLKDTNLKCFKLIDENNVIIDIYSSIRESGRIGSNYYVIDNLKNKLYLYNNNFKRVLCNNFIRYPYINKLDEMIIVDSKIINLSTKEKSSGDNKISEESNDEYKIYKYDSEKGIKIYIETKPVKLITHRNYKYLIEQNRIYGLTEDNKVFKEVDIEKIGEKNILGIYYNKLIIEYINEFGNKEIEVIKI